MRLVELKERIKKKEGKRNKMYVDSVGKRTIGYGHNLDDKPISDDACEVILMDDINDCINDLDRELSWWRSLDDVRQNVMVELAYNLGITGLCSWKNTMSFIKSGEYSKAAEKLRGSKAAAQTGNRYPELAKMIETGIL